jgi:hypothetical protein
MHKGVSNLPASDISNFKMQKSSFSSESEIAKSLAELHTFFFKKY